MARNLAASVDGGEEDIDIVELRRLGLRGRGEGSCPKTERAPAKHCLRRELGLSKPLMFGGELEERKSQVARVYAR